MRSHLLALFVICCTTGASALDDTSYLSSLGKSMAQNIHNANSNNSDTNLATIKKHFSRTGWRSLQTTLRKSGTHTLMHKHALSQTINIQQPSLIHKVPGKENTWLVSVEGDVIFNNAQLRIQQHVVDVFVVEKNGKHYEITQFDQSVSDAPKLLDKVAKHHNACPLNRK